MTSQLLKLLRLYFVILLGCFFGVAGTANSQSFPGSILNTAAIDNNRICGTNNWSLSEFNVTGIGTTDIVTLGIRANHSFRGDIGIAIAAPAGGTQGAFFLVLPDTTSAGASSEDYNIEIGSIFTNQINTGTHTAGDDVTAPPYQHFVTGNTAIGLSAFTGQPADGQWLIGVCNRSGSTDSGTVLSSSLNFFSSTAADVSLSATAAPSTIFTGGTTDVDVVLSNDSTVDMGGVTAQITIPANLTLTGNSGDGTYDAATGIWTLPDPVVGLDSYTMTLSLFANAIGNTNVTGEIITASLPDSDSTPNNNSTNEDDDFSLNFNIAAPNFPVLACPANSPLVHNWEAQGSPNGWTEGDLNNNYLIGPDDIPLDIVVSGATNRLIPLNGAITPVTANSITGGLNPPEYGLVLYTDFDTTAENVVVNMDLGTAGEGVAGAQFSIFDVDLGGPWVDSITVTGSLGGTAVTPILTSNASNTVVGNAVVGTAGNSSSQNGTMTITFQDPIDNISLTYENIITTGAPGEQFISIHAITVCEPEVADLSASKIVEPANPGEYMIPGSEIRYRIVVNNSADANTAADNIDLNDTLPDNLVFLSATATGFTGGAFGSPALPAAETDCTGGACVIHFSGASLDVDTTGELIINARIQ